MVALSEVMALAASAPEACFFWGLLLQAARHRHRIIVLQTPIVFIASLVMRMYCLKSEIIVDFVRTIKSYKTITEKSGKVNT
jgi:hypothetical protein